MATQIVVAGALVARGKLLVAQRGRPPELAGLWELPGGKVATGESEPDALVRELREELGVDVCVGARLGADVCLAGLTLRAYLVNLTGGEPQPNDHRALRWVARGDLAHLAWVPAELHLGTRTLRRQPHREQTSYRDLRNDGTRTLAGELRPSADDMRHIKQASVTSSRHQPPGEPSARMRTAVVAAPSRNQQRVGATLASRTSMAVPD